MNRRALALIAALAGCGGGPDLSPVVDVPAESSEGYPYSVDLDDLILEAARAGEQDPLVEARGDVRNPPSLSKVPFGDDLVLHLLARSHGSDAAYGRTCAVDVPAARPASEPRPRLYFSLLQRWGEIDEPVVPTRLGGAAFTLPDGSALFFGGAGGERSIERFDPISTGSFTMLERLEVSAREGAVTAPIGLGQTHVLRICGERDGSLVSTVELIGFEQVEEFSANRAVRHHAAVTLYDGGVLVSGGEVEGAGGERSVSGGAEIYLLTDDGQVAIDDDEPGELIHPRADHTMTRLRDGLDASVLVVGGRDQDGMPVPEVEIFQPSADAFELVGSPTPVRLNIPRWGHKAIRIAGRILVVGGFTRDKPGDPPTPVTQTEIYEPNLQEFKLSDDLDVGGSDFTLTTLPDGAALMIGGRDQDGAPVSDVVRLEFIDRNADVFPSAAAPLAHPRAGHAAALLCDGTVLVVGGSDAPVPAERYNPPARGRR